MLCVPAPVEPSPTADVPVDNDEDARAILERRRALVSLALLGLASAGCALPEAQAQGTPRDGGHPDAHRGPPHRACLTPRRDRVTPRMCLSVLRDSIKPPDEDE